MSDKMYQYHDDEGYGDDSYQVDNTGVDTTMYPDESNYYMGEEDRYVPKFTEKELITVIQGTKAEHRIEIKEQRKQNEEAINQLQSHLEQTLQEERMILEDKIDKKRNLIELEVNSQMPVDERESDDNMSCDLEFESACRQVQERKEELEDLKTAKEITDQAYMDIKQQFEELDYKVSKLGNQRAQSIDDFIDTNMAFNKSVRKCRELKDSLEKSHKTIDKHFKNIDVKEKALQEKEIEYTELLIKAEHDAEQNNNKFEEITKSCKQEVAVASANLRRRNMELQELNSKISEAEKENIELKSIADELMKKMEDN